jgi:predicted TIM-barrel fold metal-dependent hydrolase
MLFDANAYLGSWPFHLESELSPARLVATLAAAGIGHAAVSPLGAVFAPEPMPANRRLFAAARRQARLVPVPVINPLLANWREQLAECCDAGVRAVRLLPNYHNYALSARRLVDFMAEASAKDLRVVLTVRLEDERQRYFGLKVQAVPVAVISAFLARFPRQHVLCTALTLGEIANLARKHRNFSADLAYAEHSELARRLRRGLPVLRLMFGSLAPLISAPAQAAKLADPDFSAAERQLIGADNAREYFLL